MSLNWEAALIFLSSLVFSSVEVMVCDVERRRAALGTERERERCVEEQSGSEKC